MKRFLWTQKLTEYYAPSWPCPTCANGNLTLVPKSLVFKETVDSKQAHGHESWDPEWIIYIFTAWLKCGHPNCGEDVIISGTGSVEPNCDPEEGFNWASCFSPKYCCPMPDILKSLENVPTG